LGRFRLVVSYEGPRCTEILEVQAETLSDAESICEKIRAEHESRMSSLEARNVFVSKRMCGCEVGQNTTSSSFMTTVT
jgi:hypothetical protein